MITSMHGSVLLKMRMSSPGLRQLQALVLLAIRVENPCSHRYVVANSRRKVRASLTIVGFSFFTEVWNSPSDAVEKSCQWNSS